MSGTLAGKVGVVTGAGSGIGRATSLSMAAAGADVALADIDDTGLQNTAEAIAEITGTVPLHFHTDVSQEGDVNRLIAAILDRYGRLDCAFNNAGIEGKAATSAALTEEEWHRVIAINLTGVWLCMRAEINAMQANGGAIVNTASVAGLVGLKQSAAYIAAKHGVIGLTRSAAMDYGRYNIRVNAVCPGFIQTPMAERVFAETETGIHMAQRWQMLPQTGAPENIADAVVWLCSEAAAFVTGVALPVDGGYTAR